MLCSLSSVASTSKSGGSAEHKEEGKGSHVSLNPVLKTFNYLLSDAHTVLKIHRYFDHQSFLDCLFKYSFS